MPYNVTMQGARKLDGLLAILNLPQIVRLFTALYRDRRVSLALKAFATCGMIYIFSPLDVIPDFITGIGILDDVIVSLLIMQAFIEMAPPHVVDEHCARLKIDPARLFPNIPQAIQTALELYKMGERWMPGQPSAAPDSQPAPSRTPRQAYSASQVLTTAQPPPHSKYSAFRGE